MFYFIYYYYFWAKQNVPIWTHNKVPNMIKLNNIYNLLSDPTNSFCPISKFGVTPSIDC